jgi:PKD repeat protein
MSVFRHGPRPSATTLVVSVLALAALTASVGLLSLVATGPAALPGAGDRLGPDTSASFVVPLPPSSPAASAPTWVNVSSTVVGAPPAGNGASSAYDPADNETVLFGGCLRDGPCPSNDTWTFARGRWTNETNRLDAPPARSFASMDYDANMHAVLLFGGLGLRGYLNDTWIFRGGAWTNLTYVGLAPSPREGASMAFDPEPEENGSVLFGGCQLFCTNDTWVWRGWSGWVPLSPSFAPSARGYAALAYDPISGYLVLFGGRYHYLIIAPKGPEIVGITAFDNDTWEFYAGQWWRAYPAAWPLARGDASLVFDPSLSDLVLFGGSSTLTSDEDDTWTFAAGSWTLAAPSTSPSARDSYAFSLAGAGSTPLLFGGGTGSGATPAFGDTWVYEVPPSATVTASPSAPEAGENVSIAVGVTGGTGPDSAQVVFGDSVDGYVGGAGPTLSIAHAFARAGTYEIHANVTDAVGALAVTGVADVTVTAGIAITARASLGSTDVGRPVDFNVTVLRSGMTPDHVAWTFGDGTNATGATASHAYSAPGVYRVTVTATDALGARSVAVLSVSVAALPSVTISVAPTVPSPGVPAELLASITGGTGPFTFSWRFGNGNVSTLPSPQETFSGGTYAVEVWANDSLGSSSSASVSLQVGATPPSPGPTVLGVPWWFLAGAGALVAGGSAAGVVLARRNRRRKT